MVKWIGQAETQWSIHTTPKTKDWATWTPLNTYVQEVQHHHANHYTTEVVFNNSFGALSYIIYNHAYFLWVFDLILICWLNLQNNYNHNYAKMFLPFRIWTRGKNQAINQVCEYQRTLFLSRIVYFFMNSKNE